MADPQQSTTSLSAAQEKRMRRREKEARSLDVSKPEVLVRLEAATQAIGECKDPVRVLINQVFPMGAAGVMSAPIKTSQAHVYVLRARIDLRARLAAPRSEMLANALAGIDQAKRMAIKSGRADQLVEVLDYEALQLGLPNRTTAAKTIRVTPDELPKATAGGLTDEELLAIASKGRSTA